MKSTQMAAAIGGKEHFWIGLPLQTSSPALSLQATQLSLSPIINVDPQKHKIHNVFHLLWNIWMKTKLSESRSNILLSSSPSPSTGELRKSVKHPWSYNPPHRSWYHHRHHHCPNHFRKTNIMRADHVVLEERLSIKNINTQVTKIYLVLSASRL